MYLMMIYADQSDWDALGTGATGEPVWSEDDVQAMYGFMETLNNDLATSGELIAAAGLADPTHTKIVQMKDGVPMVTDGPYMEAKEVVGGYWVLECESLQRVIEIAQRVVSAPQPEGVEPGAVEIRPIAG